MASHPTHAGPREQSESDVKDFDAGDGGHSARN
jgi:hypothetical protein